MRAIPNMRVQTGYNCGLFSLWMALESLTGTDPQLMDKLKQGARLYTDSIGGLFNYVFIERIITHVNSYKGNQYSVRKVRFHDAPSLQTALASHANDAILIAYCSPIDVTQPPAVSSDEAAMTAHWSVLTQVDAAGDCQLANPHGSLDQAPMLRMAEYNLCLSGGRFNWKTFVNSERGDQLFVGEAKKYKNSPDELLKRGMENIDIGGYFVALGSE